MATAKEIAEWMPVEFRSSTAYQNRIANQIHSHFGQEWVYRNKNGNSAIVNPVLDEFRKLTPKDVVWSRVTVLEKTSQT